MHQALLRLKHNTTIMNNNTNTTRIVIMIKQIVVEAIVTSPTIPSFISHISRLAACQSIQTWAMAILRTSTPTRRWVTRRRSLWRIKTFRRSLFLRRQTRGRRIRVVDTWGRKRGGRRKGRPTRSWRWIERGRSCMMGQCCFMWFV